jgi:hypothetical protein
MDKTIYFSTVKNPLRNLFIKEKIKLPRYFFDNFLAFLSKICTYEEEERKIRPIVIIGYNIRKALEQVPNKYTFVATKGERNGKDLDKAMKSLVPFCLNGWHVYIDIQEKIILYGLLRGFTGPQGLTITDLLFANDDSQLEELGYGLIEIKINSSFEMKILGLRNNSLTIDYRLLKKEEKDHTFYLNLMAQDITSEIAEGDSLKLLKVFNKLMMLASQKIHGTICLVIKHDSNEIRKLLPDGNWLDEPINISMKALDSIDDSKDVLSSELFYGLSGLFIEMMNIDGITVIDNKGNIRGFNIFINKENVKEAKISGGARKRAAYSLLHTKHSDILGVYFQSQDGKLFYKRITND